MICSVILGLSFGVYPNPLALKIASVEREPFIGEGKRLEMKSTGGNLWYPIILMSHYKVSFGSQINRKWAKTLVFGVTL